ncbi:MAG: reverse transcriptase domain-containing protein [Neptuniibacter sp.]
MQNEAKWKHKFQIKPGSWVFVPTKATKRRGKTIKEDLESRWTPPDYYFHLKSGGHVQALKSHTHNNYFIHFDLKNFFNSINRSRVTRVLKGLYSYEQAREIAIESTVRYPSSQTPNYVIPFGYVQSPILASICLYKSCLGRVLHTLHKRKDVSVSVYVDDIIISTVDENAAKKAYKDILNAAERSNLPLNAEKQEGPASKITAFNIKLSNLSIAVIDGKLDEFIRDYHLSDNYDQISGIIGYVNSVNKNQAQQIR